MRQSACIYTVFILVAQHLHHRRILMQQPAHKAALQRISCAIRRLPRSPRRFYSRKHRVFSAVRVLPRLDEIRRATATSPRHKQEPSLQVGFRFQRSDRATCHDMTPPSLTIFVFNIQFFVKYLSLLQYPLRSSFFLFFLSIFLYSSLPPPVYIPVCNFYPP